MAFKQICAELAERAKRHGSAADGPAMRHLRTLRGQNSPAGPEALIHLGAVLGIMEDQGVIDTTYAKSVRVSVVHAVSITPHDTDGILVLDDLSVNGHTGPVHWKGELIQLNASDVRLVTLLARASGRIVPYDDLLEVVYPSGFPSRGTRLVTRLTRTNCRNNLRRRFRQICDEFRQTDAGFDRIRICEQKGYTWRTPPGKVR